MLQHVTWRPVPSVSAGDAPARSDDEQTIRLLGPFHIAHDDEGLCVSGDDPEVAEFAGVLLQSVTSGVVVLNVWSFITEAFPISVSIQVHPSTGTQDDYYTGLDNTAVTTASAVHQTVQAGTSEIVLYTADDGIYVCVGYTEEDGLPTAGEADIYVLIAQ